MPKFSDNEKAMIKDKLFTEGEKLFTLYGLKKVTIDDLVKRVDIAKGSFYAFYTNKEHLYMDIIENIQRKVWEDMDDFLKKNSSLPPKELMKQLILHSFFYLKKYPLLVENTSETTDYLFRKLPKEIIEQHTREDKKELLKLQEYGIKFKCEIELAAKVLQILIITFLSLQDEKNGYGSKVMEIILNGVINEIVGEYND